MIASGEPPRPHLFVHLTCSRTHVEDPQPAESRAPCAPVTLGSQCGWGKAWALPSVRPFLAGAHSSDCHFGPSVVILSSGCNCWGSWLPSGLPSCFLYIFLHSKVFGSSLLNSFSVVHFFRQQVCVECLLRAPGNSKRQNRPEPLSPCDLQFSGSGAGHKIITEVLTVLW